MWHLGRPERSLARLKDLDIDDLYDQIDTLRAYMNQLTGSAGTTASRQLGRARVYASGAAHEAEDLMKENLAASFVLALGLGVVVGYFIRRGTE